MWQRFLCVRHQLWLMLDKPFSILPNAGDGEVFVAWSTERSGVFGKEFWWKLVERASSDRPRAWRCEIVFKVSLSWFVLIFKKLTIILMFTYTLAFTQGQLTKHTCCNTVVMTVIRRLFEQSGYWHLRWLTDLAVAEVLADMYTRLCGVWSEDLGALVGCELLYLLLLQRSFALLA